MKNHVSRLAFLCLTLIFQSAFGDYRSDSHKEYGNSHKFSNAHHNGQSEHHDNRNFNPAPQYNQWDYDVYRPEWTPAPLPQPHPYQPGNLYKPLYIESELQPEQQAYPATSLYLPVFSMSTKTPMVHVGEPIEVSLTIEKGAPPYTIFWQYNDDPQWIAGSATFTKIAQQRGIVTITALVKDLNEQVSAPQKIQIVVLAAP